MNNKVNNQGKNKPYVIDYEINNINGMWQKDGYKGKEPNSIQDCLPVFT